MADLAASVSRGEVVEHPLAYQACDVVCDSVHNMVYKLAHRYSVTCRMDVDDLAQSCMKRIIERLGDYDSGIAKFTTWAWRVCGSVLNSEYGRQDGWNKNVCKWSDCEDVSDFMESKQKPSMSGLVRMDIMETVNALIERYPKRKGMILAFFGHPEREPFCFPHKVMVREAAEEMGVTYAAAHVFYSEVVVPFFRRRFSDRPDFHRRCVLENKEKLSEKVEKPTEKGEIMSDRKGGVVDAALQVLGSAGRSMTAKELFDEAVKRGLYSSKAGNPYVSFFSVLGKSLKKGGSRIVRERAGIWRAA